MYQNVYIDKKDKIIHLWDDTDGYKQLEFTNYAYRKKSNGNYTSIYGDKLEKIYDFNYMEPDLFESDFPHETKVLIYLYLNSIRLFQVSLRNNKNSSIYRISLNVNFNCIFK